jgi:phosphatidylglycerophosphate synthase
MFDATLRRASGPLLARVAAGLHRRGVPAGAITLAGLLLGLGAALAAGLGRWWPALGLWLVSRVADGLDGPVARIDGPTRRGGLLDLVADFTVYGAFVVGVAFALPEARLAATVLLCTYYVSGSAFLAWSSSAAAPLGAEQLPATTELAERAAGPTSSTPGGAQGDDTRVGGALGDDTWVGGAQDGSARTGGTQDGVTWAGGAKGGDTRDTGRRGGSLEIDDERTVRFLGGLAEGFETIVAHSAICLVPGRAATIMWVFAAMVAVTAVHRVWFAASQLGRLR